jgi:hypothetical protein
MGARRERREVFAIDEDAEADQVTHVTLGQARAIDELGVDARAGPTERLTLCQSDTGSAHVGIREHRRVEAGFGEIGVPQICTSEVGSAEICSCEGRFAQVTRAESRARKGRKIESCAGQVGANQIGADELSTSEIGLGQLQARGVSALAIC